MEENQQDLSPSSTRKKQVKKVDMGWSEDVNVKEAESYQKTKA